MGLFSCCCCCDETPTRNVVRAKPRTRAPLQAEICELVPDMELDGVDGGAKPAPSSSSSHSTAEDLVLPFGVPDDAPLDEALWQHQREKLGEARALMSRLKAAAQGKDDVIRCSVKPQGEQHPCSVQVDIGFVGTWEAAIFISVRNCDLGARTVLGMLREPELIEFPRLPGLPVLERVETAHEFAPNDLVFRVLVSPWGPIPGLADVNNAYLFDALDEDGSLLLFAQSPPEGATHHRGWPLPALPKHRKRNVISGLTMRATAAAEAPQEHPSAAAVDTDASASMGGRRAVRRSASIGPTYLNPYIAQPNRNPSLAQPIMSLPLPTAPNMPTPKHRRGA